MFLNKDFILSTEFTEQEGMHVANVSMAQRMLEDKGNYGDIVKMGNCAFINTKSKDIPHYFRTSIPKYEYTSMENLLPLSYVVTEFELSKVNIDKLVESNDHFLEHVVIRNKRFVRFSQEFKEITEKAVVNILDKTDTLECYALGYIDDYFQVSKGKYLTWYYKDCHSAYDNTQF